MNDQSKSKAVARNRAKAASNSSASNARASASGHSKPQPLADEALDHVQGAAGTVWDYIKKNDLKDKAKKTL